MILDNKEEVFYRWVFLGKSLIATSKMYKLIKKISIKIKNNNFNAYSSNLFTSFINSISFNFWFNILSSLILNGNERAISQLTIPKIP